MLVALLRNTAMYSYESPKYSMMKNYNGIRQLSLNHQYKQFLISELLGKKIHVISKDKILSVM